MNGLVVSGIIALMLYLLMFNTTPIWFIGGFLAIYFGLSWLLVPSSASRLNSVRRKIQISTWSDPVRPIVMGYFQVPISKALHFIEKTTKNTGETITITHLLIKVIGTVLQEYPEVNGKITFGNYVNYHTVDATCLVNLDDGNDLFSIRVKDIPNKPISVLAKEIKEKVDSLRVGEERKKYNQASKISDYLPTCVTAVLMEISAFTVSALGISLPIFNLEKNHFGTFILSSIGKFNTKVSYAPLVPMTRCPFVILSSSIFDEAVVRDSKVCVEKVMNLCFSVDHRFVDSLKATIIQNKIKDALEDPFMHLNTN